MKDVAVENNGTLGAEGMPKAGRENEDQEVLEFLGDDAVEEEVEEDVVFVKEDLVVAAVVAIAVFEPVAVLDAVRVEDVEEEVEVLVTGSKTSLTGPDAVMVVVVVAVVGGTLDIGLTDPLSLT